MMIENDKNILLTHKKEITKKDLEEIKPLRDLKEAIQIMERMEKKAVGKQKYIVKKALIEMHQQQYIIKNSYKPPMAAKTIVKNLTRVSLPENITINEETGEPVSDCLISLFNPIHICALLCNYSALKEDCYDKFT